MTLEIFDESPEIEWDFDDVKPVTVFDYAGDGQEQRARNQELDRRHYTWPMRRTKSEMQTIRDFFRDSNQQVTSFLVQDPADHIRTAVSLGTAGASQTVFELPTTGENSRDYPIDDSHVVVKDDGTPVTVSSVDVDARTFTLASAPAQGSVMTADYWCYRRVRLKAPVRWHGLGPDWFEAVAEFKEVVE